MEADKVIPINKVKDDSVGQIVYLYVGGQRQSIADLSDGDHDARRPTIKLELWSPV